MTFLLEYAFSYGLWEVMMVLNVRRDYVLMVLPVIGGNDDFEWLSGYGHVTSMQIRWFLSVFRSYGHVLLIVTQMTVYI